MSVLGRALKASYIHLGGGQGYSVPPSHSVIYQSPWDEPVTTPTGRSVTPKTALTYPPFFAGVRLISETMGRLPLILYRRKDEDRERARDKRLYGILHDEPNPAMSAMVYRETGQGHIITWGNCYSERVRDDLGRDKELWPLRPDRMQVLLDTDTGERFYRYRIESLGDEVDLRADQVFHIPGFGFDGRVGYSLVSLFRDALAVGLSAQEFGARFFKSGAVFPGIVTYPKSYSDQARADLKAAFQRQHSGLTNAQRVAVIEEGIEWTQVGMPLDDAQFLETQRHYRGLAATMLGLPPHMIGDVERSTSWGTGIEEQTLGFVTFSMGAHMARWQQETNRQLVRPAYGDSHYAEFLVDDLLKGRVEDRMRAYLLRWQMGSITPNEIRKKENDAPLLGGDVAYRAVNYEPIRPAEAEPAGNGHGLHPLTAEDLAVRSARSALAPPPSASDIAREIVRLGGLEKVE